AKVHPDLGFRARAGLLLPRELEVDRTIRKVLLVLWSEARLAVRRGGPAVRHRDAVRPLDRADRAGASGGRADQLGLEAWNGGGRVETVAFGGGAVALRDG